MALRLSKAVDPSAEGWLAPQGNYNLWLARTNVNLNKVSEADHSMAR